MATAAERQSKFKAQMRAHGLVQVNVWVHEHQASDIQVAARLMAADPDLELRNLRDAPSGRITKIR